MSNVHQADHGASNVPAVIVQGALADHQPVVESVPPLESIELPVSRLQAVLLCASKEDTRAYLNGVFVHRTEDGFVRAVATDGKRLMVANLYREYADQPGPAWLSSGVIVPADGLAARLTLIAKTHGKTDYPLTLAYAEGSAKIELSDAMGASTFKLAPVGGDYPDYSPIVGKWSGGEGTPRGDWQPTGFNPKHLKSVSDIAHKLGADGVACFGAARTDKGDGPCLFTFTGVGGVALILMPEAIGQAIPASTRELLAPAIKLTLAALRAHETRNRKAAKKSTGAEKDAAIARADEFAERIKALVERAGSGDVTAALPAPKPVPQPEPEPEGFDITEALAADTPAAPVEEPKNEQPATKAEPRQKSKKAKARKSRKS